MDFGQVEFTPPEDPRLIPWIKGYYIHADTDPEFHTKVTFYQNITTTLSIYKDSITRSAGRYRQQHYSKGAGFTTLLVGLVDKYQEVEFFGPLDRIAVVFHPGGINHFLDPPLGNLLERHYSMFTAYGDEFDTFLSRVFEAKGLLRKRQLLDAFLVTKFKAFEEVALLNAIDYLTQDPMGLKVEALAGRLGLSRRTLLRKFKKHLGYSVEEYKQVIKFRKALLTFQKNRNEENLAQIALDSSYYDQPDFNHHIKTQSDLTPKALFKQLRIVDDTLFWKP
ncbi:AraC family transcriptional regulator [Flagellimonas sp. DF-77]|uniref:helix-turn-helix domain-containing protein n=1 Tax=Flagellimonas algarum TaxID=3230298 RepID=UPI00339245C3